MDKETFEKQVNELTLALLYLNRFNERGDFSWRSWKGYDFDSLNILTDQGMLYDTSHRSKSVSLTDEGTQKAKELLKQLHMEDPWESSND